MKRIITKYHLAGIIVVLLFGLIGCTSNGESVVKAVYLTPESGGQLTEGDIKNYPEVIRVTNFDELKDSVTQNTAIWIDKGAVDLLDQDWLREEAQNRIPIVLIGYNDALYSFRDTLSCFGIEGPNVDWSERELEPGFSVWMIKEKTDQSQSAFMKEYDMTPDTKQILAITNKLLDGEFPE